MPDPSFLVDLLKRAGKKVYTGLPLGARIPADTFQRYWQGTLATDQPPIDASFLRPDELEGLASVVRAAEDRHTEERLKGQTPHPSAGLKDILRAEQNQGTIGPLEFLQWIGGGGSRTDPSSIATSLGRFNINRLDPNQVDVTDSWDWPVDSNKPNSFQSLPVSARIPMMLANPVQSVRYFGEKVAPEGKGRKVDIQLPVREGPRPDKKKSKP